MINEFAFHVMNKVILAFLCCSLNTIQCQYFIHIYLLLFFSKHECPRRKRKKRRSTCFFQTMFNIAQPDEQRIFDFIVIVCSNSHDGAQLKQIIDLYISFTSDEFIFSDDRYMCKCILKNLKNKEKR